MSDKPKIHLDLPTGVQATDLTQVFTSKPYPVVVIEAITSRGNLLDIDTFQGIVEAVEVSGDVTGVELRPILQSTTMEDEAVAVTADVTALTLDTVLVETTIEDEAVGVTATVTSLTLESQLVSTTMEDEAVAVTATITGLELS